MARLRHSCRSLAGLIGLELRLRWGDWIVNLFVGVLLPLAFYTVLDGHLVAEGGSRVLLGLAIAGALTLVLRQLAIGMVADRVLGRRALLTASGVTWRTYLIARCTTGLSLACAGLLVLCIGMAFGKVAAPISQTWLAPFFLVALGFSAIGVCVAGVVSGLPTATVVTNGLLTFTLAFCPVVYPAEQVPATLLPVVSLLPPTLGTELFVAGWQGEPWPDRHFSLLAAWTFAAVAAALVVARRDERRAATARA